MNKILAFDTLKYANRLKQINVPPEQAELQAEVMKEVLESAFQTAELATKSDVNNAIVLVRKDMEAMEQRLGARIDASDTKIDGVEQSLSAKIDGVEQRSSAKIDAVEQRLNARFDALVNKLVIRMTGILVAGIGATAAVMALIPRFFH